MNYSHEFSKKIIDEIMDGKLKKYLNFFKSNLDKKNFLQVKKVLELLNDNDLRMTIKDRILSPKYDLYDEKILKKKLYSMGFKNFKRTCSFFSKSHWTLYFFIFIIFFSYFLFFDV